jgi:hypothetical protein
MASLDRLATAEGSSTTAADEEAPPGTLLQLPSDVVRKVAAFTFAAPSRKSCSIEFDGQKKRRDALEGSRHASALVVAIPNSHDELRRALRADLDKAEQARGFGLTVAEGDAWLRAHGYGSDALATPRAAGELLLLALSEFTEDRTSQDYFMKKLKAMYGQADASEIVLRHDCLTDEVRALLAYGAVPDCQTEKGETPLHLLVDTRLVKASNDDDSEGADPVRVAEYLLLAGADPNLLAQPHHFGRAPLSLLFSALKFNAEMATSGVQTYTGPFNKFKAALEHYIPLVGLARCLILNGANVHEAELDYTSAEWPSSDTRNPSFNEILTLQLHMLRDASAVLLEGDQNRENNRPFFGYCLNRANVLSKLLASCSMLQNPAARCDLDELLSFYDVGPKTPDEHEKFLYEFSASFAGCRDGENSDRATPQEESSPDTSSSEDSPTTSARFHAWMNGSDDE